MKPGPFENFVYAFAVTAGMVLGVFGAFWLLGVVLKFLFSP